MYEVCHLLDEDEKEDEEKQSDIKKLFFAKINTYNQFSHFCFYIFYLSVYLFITFTLIFLIFYLNIKQGDIMFFCLFLQFGGVMTIYKMYNCDFAT